MLNNIKRSLTVAVVLLSLTSTLYGGEYGWSGEYYKGLGNIHYKDGENYKTVGQKHYQDKNDGFYIWRQYTDCYFQKRNIVADGYFSSYEAARNFAHSIPEINLFYYVGPRGIWGMEGADYASDSYLIHENGFAEFFSGGGGILYNANGTNTYFKQSVVARPPHYAQNHLKDHLAMYPEILSPDVLAYLEMNCTLEEAFEVADNDPQIVHFIVLEKDHYFDDPRLINPPKLGQYAVSVYDGRMKSKNTIFFFNESLPTYLDKNFEGIWIYSKK